MSSKKTLILALVGLMAIFAIGCTSGEKDTADSDETGPLAATVNDTGITMEEFENTVDRMKAFYEQQGLDFEGDEGAAILEEIRLQAINDLVQQEVILQNAREKGYDVSDQQINEQIEQIKAQFPSDEDYQTALKESWLTEDELKSMIASELRIDQFTKNEIPEATITDEEIQQMYDGFKLQYGAEMDEGTEEDKEFPSLEELKTQIEAQIKQQKEQMLYDQMIEELMANSDIEVLI